VDPFDRFLGEALREARMRKGWTLGQASELSGGRFRPTSIAGYERGERQVSLRRFAVLAGVYGVRADRLLAHVLERMRADSLVLDLTPEERRLEEKAEKEEKIVDTGPEPVISSGPGQS
jgi:transcriptional regulator with XRE-family HTH domain